MNDELVETESGLFPAVRVDDAFLCKCGCGRRVNSGKMFFSRKCQVQYQKNQGLLPKSKNMSSKKPLDLVKMEQIMSKPSDNLDISYQVLEPSDNLDRLYHLAKNLYNEGNYLIRQEFSNNGKKINFRSLFLSLKTSNNYLQLPAQIGRQVLKTLDRNWRAYLKSVETLERTRKAYFKAIKNAVDKPNDKLKNDSLILGFTEAHVKLKDNVLRFPQKVGLNVKLQLPDLLFITKVRIIPNGVEHVLEINYCPKRRID